MTPFDGERLGEIDDRTLGGIVGDRLHVQIGAVTAEACDGGDIEDAPILRGDHGKTTDLAAEHEDRSDIQVHDLVPGVERIVFRRRAPCGAGIVDENLDARATGLKHFRGEIRYFVDPRQISGNADRLPAADSDMGNCLIELGLLARRQDHPRAVIGKHFGKLQAKPAGATGDQGRLARQVEQVSHSRLSPKPDIYRSANHRTTAKSVQ